MATEPLATARATALLATAIALASAAALGAVSPADAAPGSGLRLDRDGDPRHLHVGERVGVWTAKLRGERKLRRAIGDARRDWRDKLAGETVLELGRARQRGQAHVRFDVGRLGGKRLARVRSPSERKATRGKPARVTFDRDRLDGRSRKKLRGHACRAIGRALGLADAGKARDDCMERPGRHRKVKRGRTLELVDGLYGGEVDLAGSLWRERERLRSGESYEIEATASGHALTGLRIEALELELADRSAAPCEGFCELEASVELNRLRLPPGRYALRATLSNDFGPGRTVEVDLWAGYPYFGYNDDWQQAPWLDTTPGSGPYSAAHEGGSNAARMGVNWAALETCGGPPADLSRFERAFSRLKREGMRPLVVIVSAPPCKARSCETDAEVAASPPLRSADPDWRELVRRVADRAEGALGIEVWNESNGARFWGGCPPDPERFAELNRLAAAGIARSSQPELPLVVGGPMPGGNMTDSEGRLQRYEWRSYLERALADGLPAGMPLAIHPYRTLGECRAGIDTATSVASQLDDAIALAPRREIWVTEVGIASRANGAERCPAITDPDRHAAELVEVHDLLREREVPVAIFHRFVDLPAGGNAFEESLGVMRLLDPVRRTFAPKPAYCELARARGEVGRGC